MESLRFLIFSVAALVSVFLGHLAQGAPYTSKVDEFIGDILNPCGFPVTSVSLKDLPNTQVIIAETQNQALRLRDVMLSRIDNSQLRGYLLVYYWGGIEHMNPTTYSVTQALQNPHSTQDKIVRLLHEYQAWVRMIRWNEEYFAGSYGGTDTAAQEVQALERSGVASLACAIEQVAVYFGVKFPGAGVDSARDLVLQYTSPTNKLYADAVAAQILNTMANDFLAFTDMFYKQLLN